MQTSRQVIVKHTALIKTSLREHYLSDRRRIILQRDITPVFYLNSANWS